MNTTPWKVLATALLLGSLGTLATAGEGPELSREQRSALRSLRESLQEQGADAAACRAAHDSLWNRWGLDAPMPPGGRGPCGEGLGPGPKGDGPRLSKAQRRELRALRDKLLDEGASPETLREEHDKLFQSWGLEAPPACEGRGPCGEGIGPGPRGDGPRLSKAQRQELRALRDKLEDEGASPETLREEHDKLFQSWGLEAPPVRGGRGPCGKRAGRGPCGKGQRNASTIPAGRAFEPVREARATPVLALVNHPNPFNPSTEIRYTLPTDGEVLVAVYDMKGTLVQEVLKGRQGAGEHRVRWEGRNTAGEEVASGSYILRVQGAGHHESRTITLLR